MEKTVLITGASSGIGKETAELFAKNGYKVFACVRKTADKNKLEKINKNIQGVYLDVTNNSGIDKAYWYVLKKTLKYLIGRFLNVHNVENCAKILILFGFVI